MKAVIYIADLYPENAHLMPWRVPLEIAKHWPEGDDSVSVWSGTDDVWKISKGELLISWLLIRYIPRVIRDISDLQKRITASHIDVLYFPVAFTHCYDWAESLENETGCRVVWYLPGGWFGMMQCIRALRYMHWKKILPYLLQAFFPKQRFFNELVRGRCRNLICFSDESADKARNFCPEHSVFAAIPGSDLFLKNETKEQAGNRYFLFFGPPDPIRGIDVLLKAFESVIRKYPDCRLHLCLRPDTNTEISRYLEKVNSSPVKNRIDVCMRSLDKEELRQEIQGCFAVTMPSLIVPSEIPLSVLEATRMGKIVLASGPDGTGAFVSQFGLVSKHGSVSALARNMIALLEDTALYRNLSEVAVDIAQNLPGWNDTAKIWCEAGMPSLQPVADEVNEAVSEA